MTELVAEERINAWKDKKIIPFFHTMQKKDNFNSCITENRYATKNGKIYQFAEGQVYTLGENEDFINSPLKHIQSQFSYVVESLDSNEGYETNKVYICGNSEEEVLEIFFIKSNSLSYCNGHHVAFSGDNADFWKSKFNKYFYKDKEGIGRYANMGGNMD